jgi:hypothetical protein
MTLPYSLERRPHGPYVCGVNTLNPVLRNCRCQNETAVIPDLNLSADGIDDIGFQCYPRLPSFVRHIFAQ